MIEKAVPEDLCAKKLIEFIKEFYAKYPELLERELEENHGIETEARVQERGHGL